MSHDMMKTPTGERHCAFDRIGSTIWHHGAADRDEFLRVAEIRRECIKPGLVPRVAQDGCTSAK